jgi:cytoskeletal protein CcmA (bactofilin family)
MGLDESCGWFQQAPNPDFTKATVSTGGYRSRPAPRPSSVVCLEWPVEDSAGPISTSLKMNTIAIGPPSALSESSTFTHSREDCFEFMWGKSGEQDSRRVTVPEMTSIQVPQQAPPGLSHKPRMTSTIGQTMRLKGEVLSDEELYLDGDFEGAIEVHNLLTIGPNGKVVANVKAKELVVRGSIRGNVEATGRISIMTGASIVGDVKTAGIVIEDGAYFKGGIDIIQPEHKIAEARASAPQSAVTSQMAGG